VLQCAAVQMLQCVAVRGSILQCVAVCIHMNNEAGELITIQIQLCAPRHVLQRVAVRCSVLHYAVL